MNPTDDFGFLEEKREVDIESYPCGLYSEISFKGDFCANDSYR
jgi:hypothetical protein